jgi:hypothetical protein
MRKWAARGGGARGVASRQPPRGGWLSSPAMVLGVLGLVCLCVWRLFYAQVSWCSRMDAKFSG